MRHIDNLGPTGCVRGARGILLGEHNSALDEKLGIQFTSASNWMWPALAEAFGTPICTDTRSRIDFLKNEELMMMDLLCEWEDDGSMASHRITSSKCADMREICRENPDAVVMCFSRPVYSRFCSEFPDLKGRAVYMHSTSSSWIRQMQERKDMVVLDIKRALGI